MQIFVDADACPVVDIVETIAVTDLMSCHGFAHMNCHQIDWFSVISQPHRTAA